jgi:hypothetical protein
MNNDFWERMQSVSEIMTTLEEENKRYFSNEEQTTLLSYKKNFVESCLFWAEAEGVTDKEKMSRVRWEYNNMFDALTDLINNNVDEYERNKDEEF